jgi:hypothetical protein
MNKDKAIRHAIKEISEMSKWRESNERLEEWKEKLEEVVIEIGSNGGRFLSEGNMVYRPLLELYTDKLQELFKEKPNF